MYARKIKMETKTSRRLGMQEMMELTLRMDDIWAAGPVRHKKKKIRT